MSFPFSFLYDWKILPDNNASERAVRTFKVKQKVSGLFCSTEGVNAFGVIRSVIDTIIKNTQNVLKAPGLLLGCLRLNTHLVFSQMPRIAGKKVHF
ncbi:MAG: transposase [Dysgonamonadaceae bacterium]|nr:transposase [Dysgonamonadaceae bacterium]